MSRQPSAGRPAPPPCIATLLALLSTLSAPVVAQVTAPPAPWSAHVTAGYGRSLRGEALGGGLSLGAGIFRGRGATRLGLEVSFAQLGHEARTTHGFDPLPVFTPTIISTTARERMLGIGLAVEAGPRAGRIRPALLLSAGRYGLWQESRRTVRDSATSQVLDRSADRGWAWGWGVSAGVALTLPPAGPFGSPRVEARLHGLAAKRADAWTTLPVVSLGVGVGW